MSPVESVADSFPRFLARGERRRAAELDELRIRTREFAQEHVVPVALEIDAAASADPTYFAWEMVREAGKYGMLSDMVPKPAGGTGGLGVSMSLMMEELSAACPGAATIIGAHGLGVLPVLMVGGPSHWDGVLREIVTEAESERPVLFAAALTEPGAGTDMENPELVDLAELNSRAERVDGGYRLYGTKRFISNGDVAKWIATVMPVDQSRPSETSIFCLVDAQSDGFSVSRVEHKMGQRACHAAELSYDGVFVPDSLVVGREGDGFPATMMVLTVSRAPVGAIGTGIARGAYDRLLHWLRHDGRADGLLATQPVQLALARMRERIHVGRQAYMDAAMLLDDATMAGALNSSAIKLAGMMPRSLRTTSFVRNKFNSAQTAQKVAEVFATQVGDGAMSKALGMSSLAKALGGDVGMEVTGMALEIAGLECGDLRPELEKLWRDAKLVQIFEGTNQLNRLEVFSTICMGESMPITPRIDGVAA